MLKTRATPKTRAFPSNFHLTEHELSLGLPQHGFYRHTGNARFAALLTQCKNVTMVLVGGSVSVGCCARRAENGFWQRFVSGILSQFPCTDTPRLVRAFNFAQSATGPGYMSVCLSSFFDPSNVDLVVVEYATNCNTEQDAQLLPSLVTQLAKSGTGVVFLNHYRSIWMDGWAGKPRTRTACRGVFEDQSRTHRIPILKTHPLFVPPQGPTTTCTLVPDGTHPTDSGHGCLADLLMLWTIRLAGNTNGTTSLIRRPSTSKYPESRCYGVASGGNQFLLKPARTEDSWLAARPPRGDRTQPWALSHLDSKRLWLSNMPGSTVSFAIDVEWSGAELVVVHLKSNSWGGGSAMLWLDGHPPRRLDGFMTAWTDNVNLAFPTGIHLRKGKHEIGFTIMNETTSPHNETLFGLFALAIVERSIEGHFETRSNSVLQERVTSAEEESDALQVTLHQLEAEHATQNRLMEELKARCNRILGAPCTLQDPPPPSQRATPHLFSESRREPLLISLLIPLYILCACVILRGKGGVRLFSMGICIR